MAQCCQHSLNAVLSAMPCDRLACSLRRLGLSQQAFGTCHCKQFTAQALPVAVQFAPGHYIVTLHLCKRKHENTASLPRLCFTACEVEMTLNDASVSLC